MIAREAGAIWTAGKQYTVLGGSHFAFQAARCEQRLGHNKGADAVMTETFLLVVGFIYIGVIVGTALLLKATLGKRGGKGPGKG